MGDLEKIEKMDVEAIELTPDDVDQETEEELTEKFQEKCFYTWKLPTFTAMSNGKNYSPDFEHGGYKWRILLFPRGNNNADNVSMYLDAADGKQLPYGWHRHAEFELTILNRTFPEKSLNRSAKHRFHAEEADWGFTQFHSLKDILDVKSGFLANDDTLIVRASVRMVKEFAKDTTWHSYWNYDSKKETGFVGLKNQGATCYMNSLLQALFHTGCFRRAVYQLPTTAEEIPTKSIPLALQRLFYRLQFDTTSVSTKELTTSFGWDAYETFTQHDVQELNRVLCDNLEGKMKGTPSEGIIDRLFKGEVKNYIKCMNVDYESSRVEAYYDISLNVKGCKDIYESFDNYVEIERLEGDNQYRADQFGLQDASKGCFFMSFPPVLHLQLKRFEYDPFRDANVKLNDKYIFPPILDLEKYAAPNTEQTCSFRYQLHGVLVHSGDVHGGHYYAYVRPTGRADWYKFDDERVTKATIDAAIEDNYGGEEEHSYSMHGRQYTSTSKRTNSAYMLIYVRDTDVEDIVGEVPERDIPRHLLDRFDAEREEEEQKRKEREEAHLYSNIKVVRFENLAAHEKIDLVAWEDIKSFKVLKTSTIKEFKDVVEQEYGVPKFRQRFWTFAGRQNKTIRPDVLLTPRMEDTPIGEQKSFRQMTEIKLLLEVAPDDAKDEATAFPALRDDEILLFFKRYDPEKEDCRFIGYRLVKNSLKVSDLVPIMNQMADYPPNTKLWTWEEIKPSMIEATKPKKSLKELEIGNGDIIIFQAEFDSSELKKYRHPKAPDFLDYMLNRIAVHFHPLDKPKDRIFSLTLNKKMKYDQVAEAVGTHLEHDPVKLRFTAHNSYYDQPKLQPIKRNDTDTLSDMLAPSYQPATDIIYFEKLEVSLVELENKKPVKITWTDIHVQTKKVHSLLMPKDSKVKDVLDQLKSLETMEDSGQLRLMEVWNNKIYKVMDPNDGISYITEYTKMRAEEIPTDELNMASGSKRVQVAHFNRDTHMVHTFGDPFYFVIGKDETAASVKQRLQEKLQVPEKDYPKYRIAYVSYSRPEYLSDTDIVAKHDYQSTDFLGIEHPDNTPKQHHARYGGHDKPIKIYG